MKALASKLTLKNTLLIMISLLLLGVGAKDAAAKVQNQVPCWIVYPEKTWIKINPAKAGFDVKKFNRLIVNSTVKGAKPVVGSALADAVGGLLDGALTVIVIVFVPVAPSSSVTVNFTWYVPVF